MNTLDRTIAPNIRKTNSFSLQKPIEKALSNGIHFYIFKNKELDLIHFSLRIRAGSLFEPAKSIANSAYSLLIESAVGKSAAETEEFLDFYGSSFNISVAFEYVTLSFVIPKRNCLKVLPFIFDFITSPVYDETALLQYKQRKFNDLEYNLLKPGYCADQLMYHNLLNPLIPVGKILCREDIENITVFGMEAYHRDTFCAENINLFIAGNIDDDEIRLLSRFCENIPTGKPSRLPQIVPNVQDIQPEKLIIEQRDNLSQSSIRICKRLFAYENPDRHDFAILNTILGDYFGSRLMKNLREEKGYTYGIFSHVVYFGDNSIFYMDTDVNMDKTKDAIAQCQKELERLCHDLVSEEELTIVKSYLQGALLRRLDGTVDYMRNYCVWQSAGLDANEQQRTMEAIEQITPVRILQLAQQYLNPNDFIVIVVGQ
jgi:predicted Zn-dependent peptidase